MKIKCRHCDNSTGWIYECGDMSNPFEDEYPCGVCNSNGSDDTEVKFEDISVVEYFLIIWKRFRSRFVKHQNSDIDPDDLPF